MATVPARRSLQEGLAVHVIGVFPSLLRTEHGGRQRRLAEGQQLGSPFVQPLIL
jgi:hypothetical protein